MEKREYPMGGQEISTPLNTTEAVVYEDKAPLPYAEFSAQNIDERIKAQELFDKVYLQGNDVAFKTQPIQDDIKIEPNSHNT
jgi:hypothetical protein